MSQRKILKLIHVASTAWFILSVGYIMVYALRRAGIHWWVIFSLSGHSVLIVFLLISLYLFAIFRGIGGSQTIEAEHPLTSTNYYTALYITIPILGGLGGCLGMVGIPTVKEFFLGVALGTLGATFLVWVIVDPVIGMLEVLLPASCRKHRAQRLAEAKAEREEKQRERESFLAEILSYEESDRLHWQEVLKPHAEKLAGLLTADINGFRQAENEAIGIGVKAWQTGGVNCMRQLRDMAIGIYKQKNPDRTIVDYISSWWDGIGSWRIPSLQEMINIQG